jgi:N-glycosidase YbiA
MNITPPPIPSDNRILYFQRDREQFLFFSHFHPSPIVLDGETWPTVEHYFQAQRSDDPAYRQAIREEKSPGKVKHLSKSADDTTRGGKRFSWFRSNHAVPRADWADIELDVMRKADGAKFTQNPDFSALLLATGDADLIEDSPWDAFWGIGADGSGLNWAGKILMEIRRDLRASRPVVQPKPQ